MAEQQDGSRRVGTVAEEAARLVDAFASWSESARQSPDGPSEEGESRYAGSAGSPGSAGSTGSPGSAAGDQRCAACGAETGAGRAVTCGVCPLCQGLALLRAVRPETVDRLADLAAAVTATLRDVAAQTRAQRPPDGHRAGPGQRDANVQDIPVDDGDEPSSRHEPDGRQERGRQGRSHQAQKGFGQ